MTNAADVTALLSRVHEACPSISAAHVHTIFGLTIETVSQNERSSTFGRLQIVDLAALGTCAAAGVMVPRTSSPKLRWATTLHAVLGSIISAKPTAPFYDSKITSVIRDALRGDAHLVWLALVPPRIVGCDDDVESSARAAIPPSAMNDITLASVKYCISASCALSLASQVRIACGAEPSPFSQLEVMKSFTSGRGQLNARGGRVEDCTETAEPFDIGDMHDGDGPSYGAGTSNLDAVSSLPDYSDDANVKQWCSAVFEELERAREREAAACTRAEALRESAAKLTEERDEMVVMLDEMSSRVQIMKDEARGEVLVILLAIKMKRKRARSNASSKLLERDR